jgi:ligand-binding sensor domain-containing protein
MFSKVILWMGWIALLASCTAPTTSGSGKSAMVSQPAAIGETVAALGNSILIVYQAVNGDYWFGSDVDGVYRWDGKVIVHFDKDDGLSNNSIREIKEDRNGNVFFSTQQGGISKYDGHSLSTLPVVKSASPETNWRLEPQGLWFKGETGKNGPYRYDGQVLHDVAFPKHYLADAYYAQFPDKPWSPYEIYYIYQDRSGVLWFGTSNFGICRYDGKTLSWLYEEHLTLVEGGGSFGIRSILQDKEGKFWFCNSRYRYNIQPSSTTTEGKTLIDYTRTDGIPQLRSPDGKDRIYFLSAVEDAEGNLWMATYAQGVWKYDGKKVTHYEVREGDQAVTLFSIYKDRQGQLWLGTHAAGAFRWNGKEFERFSV